VQKPKPRHDSVRVRVLAAFLPAVLATATASGSLGGQSLFLRLGAEEAAVLEFPQNPGVLYRSPEPIY
tara:strand:+ start:201 stop:404 length:204 start_codon:yes stop_codon:yes gene_type:complete